ncbi:MAG TPA: ABC transporter substrate-binding protein, partial [Candidatus Peribacteraceae bacterium]|nr:ABC transporter substrate-binding protein [Candidatus Peribacteraceae bacterium]
MKKLCLAMLCALSVAACKPTSSTEPIKIGFIGPLTGDAAALGVDILHGIQIAVDDANATGGIDGRQIQIVAEDGRCTGADAASAAQKLINVDKVVAILGGQCSGETLAIAPIAEAAGVPIISAISSNPDVTEAGEFIFRVYPSDALKTVVMAKYFADNDWKRVAILTTNADFSVGF